MDTDLGKKTSNQEDGLSMKRVLLAGFVIFTFIIYSFHQRQNTVSPVLSPIASASPSNSTNSTATSAYKDGRYVGDVADAFYGNIQVQATVQGGKLTDVTFLQYPNDRRNSIEINNQAMPYLKQEAIKAQSAQVDGVSGATDTSQAFVQSLTAALKKAQA